VEEGRSGKGGGGGGGLGLVRDRARGRMLYVGAPAIEAYAALGRNTSARRRKIKTP